MIIRKIAIAFLITVSIGRLFGQTDNIGNPVFNSISTGEKTIDDFRLISNYYTLRNNIENKLSLLYLHPQGDNALPVGHKTRGQAVHIHRCQYYPGGVCSSGEGSRGQSAQLHREKEKEVKKGPGIQGCPPKVRGLLINILIFLLFLSKVKA